MTIEGEVLAAGLTWFLDTFCTPVVDSAKAKVQRQRQEFDWVQAAETYRESLLHDYGRIPVFGKNTEVSMDDVFTTVYILDRPTAHRRFNIDQLREQGEDRFAFQQQPGERINGMALVKGNDNLYILGKPGAGKTTFLKYLTVQAARRNLNRIPIFVSLNQWANSDYDDLLPFIVRQFEICRFPEAEPFVKHLLQSGHALVLFDGLDEVKTEDERRHRLTWRLRDFATEYRDCQVLITCRIAAEQYDFPGFVDVEVADFDEEQVQKYAEQWFGADTEKFALFRDALTKDEHVGLRELCNSPLLLSMLCLAFDETMHFPPNRGELYEEALNALLKKWDASRGIQRDPIFYGHLTRRRKEQLFARIAARTFEKNEYFLEQRWLEDHIVEYLARLPNAPHAEEIDGESVLDGIAAQTGILVERAHGIYSFSHLTFQEYFAAKYIVDNGTTDALIHSGLTDPRWREVFLLTASLLDEADDFVLGMRTAIDGLVAHSETLVRLLTWVEMKTKALDIQENQKILAHIIYITLMRDFARATTETRGTVNDFVHSRAITVPEQPSLAQQIFHSSGLNITASVNSDPLDNAFRHVHTLIEDCPVASNTKVLEAELRLDLSLMFVILVVSRHVQAPELQENSQAIYMLNTLSSTLRSHCKFLKYPALDKALKRLNILHIRSEVDEWKVFLNRLHWIVEIERTITLQWRLKKVHLDSLKKYLLANELLVRCLDVASVSPETRQAILDGLFAPPRQG